MSSSGFTRKACLCVIVKTVKFFVFVLHVYRESYMYGGRCVLRQYVGCCEAEKKEFDDLMISFPFRKSAGLKHEWHMSEFPRLLGK